MESLPQADKGEDYKIKVFCRMRPEHAGIADIPAGFEKDFAYDLKSVESKQISFQNKNSDRDNKTFKFMESVITDDMAQQQCFDVMMPPFLERFYAGYNVNFLCYGQTGSGKTHTALGPPGTFSKTASLSGEIEDHFGMFPRACI